MQSFFYEICKPITERVIKHNQLRNIDESGFIQKKQSHKVVVPKGFRSLWSKSSDANFHMNFFVCVSAAKYLVPPL